MHHVVGHQVLPGVLCKADDSRVRGVSRDGVRKIEAQESCPLKGFNVFPQPDGTVEYSSEEGSYGVIIVQRGVVQHQSADLHFLPRFQGPQGDHFPVETDRCVPHPEGEQVLHVAAALFSHKEEAA